MIVQSDDDVEYDVQPQNTTETCDYTFESPSDSLDYFNQKKSLYIFHITICVISITASSVNVTVLTRPPMRLASINVLLLAMEISNLVLSTHYLPICIMKYSYRKEYYLRADWVQAQTYLNIVQQSAVCFTVWMTAAVAMWRCVAIVWPFQASRLLTHLRAILVTLVLAGVCLMFITVYHLVTLKIENDTVTYCADSVTKKVAMTVRVYSIRPQNFKHFATVGIVTFFSFFVVPTLLSMVATFALLWNIVVSVRRRNRMLVTPRVEFINTRIRTSVVLTVMVFSFSVSNFTPYLSTILQVFGSKKDLPHPWDYIFDEAVLGLFVNCLSFFGFYFMGTRFRETFLNLIKCPRLKKAKSYGNVSIATIMHV